MSSLDIVPMFTQKSAQTFKVGKSVPLVRTDVLQYDAPDFSFVITPHAQQVRLILGFVLIDHKTLPHITLMFFATADVVQCSLMARLNFPADEGGNALLYRSVLQQFVYQA